MHVLHKTRQCDSVSDLPFDQIEPSCSLQTRSGNPVRTPKSERDFPTSEYAGFYEWVNERLMTNLDYSFKLTLNHQGPYNSKMSRY